MCGIVGYVGHRPAAEIILEGLRRLEYRGYDSAGLAVLNQDGLHVRRRPGKLQNLEDRLTAHPLPGAIGIGHTRWATHGRPSKDNAHPHGDCSRSLVVVHNGILENYQALKDHLLATGHRFRSETDTEILPHLIETHVAGGLDLLEAVRASLAEVRGSYAIVVLSAREPDRLVAAKRGAGAVVVGFGDGEAYLASDIPALLPHTREVVILEDDEVAVVTRSAIEITARNGDRVERAPTWITWDAAMAQRAGYPHFMLKEIYEQPRAVLDTLRGQMDSAGAGIHLPEAHLPVDLARSLRRAVFVACGTSYHSAMVGRFMLEKLAGLPTEVDLGSEFRYRDPLVGPDALVVAISQSGETADTLGAVKAARARGATVLGITNTVGSTLAREATGVLYTHAGPEIGVASSKTFTATLTACYLLGIVLGRDRGHLSPVDERKRLDDLLEVPALMEQTVGREGLVQQLARTLVGYANFLYLGRGIQAPIALEGALKLKELAYAHAEGFAAGEMKHGPIALIDRHMPVVGLVPRDPSYERMMANLEEVKARDGIVIAVSHDGDDDIARRADHIIRVPAVVDLLSPMITVIPLQLLAYHITTLRGLDVDRPRNLAKSVTVE